MPSLPPPISQLFHNSKIQYALSSAGGGTAGAVIGGLVGAGIGASVSLGIGTGVGAAIGAAIGGASGTVIAAGGLFVGKKVLQHLQNRHPAKDLEPPPGADAEPTKPLKQRISHQAKKIRQEATEAKTKIAQEFNRRFKNDIARARDYIEPHIEELMRPSNPDKKSPKG